MKYFNTRWMSLALLLSTTVSLWAGERKVLTIAVDGLRPDALIAANTPNIDSLLNGTFFGTGSPSGIFATYAQSEHLTFSGPGWGAYMTGLHVDRHGADTNEFQNVVPGTTDWFTPLEAFDPSLNTHRVLTWQIAHQSFPSGADTSVNFEYNANGDQLMTNHVVGLMQNAATDAVMTFYSDVDGAGHTYGFDPSSPQYLAEIANTDSQIGQIMAAMAARPNFANEDWLVVLTSDHGGIGTGHSGGLPLQRAIPFIVAGKLATTTLPQAHPRQVDVASTVLAYFGAPQPANYDGHAIGLAPAGPAAAGYGQNVIFNGDAEYGRGFVSNTTQQYAAGWDAPGPGGVTQLTYSAGGGFPTSSDPGPVDRGNNFFSGGTNAVSTMTQRIDVSNLSGAIQAGAVDFLLSAWLGGYSNQNDVATVIARYYDGSNSQIGLSQLAAVTATERGNVTSLLYRELFGDLPTATQSIQIELTATRGTGQNDGYADEISLLLLRRADLDFNGIINAGDWSLFRAGQHQNLGSLSILGKFQAGDINNDGFNNHADFVLFKTEYELTNGAGSFAAMLAVPEPSSIVLMVALVVLYPLFATYRRSVS